MSGSFSLGLVIGASVSSNFTSAMLGSQRALTKLADSTDKLKHRQQNLLQSARHYGTEGADAARRIHAEYQRLGRDIKTLTSLQNELSASTKRGEQLKTSRAELFGKATSFAAKTAVMAAPVIRAVKGYAAEESRITGIAQGAGDFSPAFKQHLLAQTRKTAMQTAQSNDAILGIMDTLTDAQQSLADKNFQGSPCILTPD